MQLLSRVLCAAILLNAAAAQAYEPVYESQGFTLGRSEFDPAVPISVSSDTGNAVSFSLWGMEEGLFSSTDSSHQPWSNDYKTLQAAYGITVKDGYRITGITVTGTFHGSLDPAEWTMPGDANNHLRFGLHAGVLPFSTSESDVDGQQAFMLGTGAVALDGEFGLWLDGSSESSAASVWYYDEMYNEEYWLGSQATAGMRDLTMTVTVAAVPEPGTYAMLVAGLGLLGAVARRRNASTL